MKSRGTGVTRQPRPQSVPSKRICITWNFVWTADVRFRRAINKFNRKQSILIYRRANICALVCALFHVNSLGRDRRIEIMYSTILANDPICLRFNSRRTLLETKSNARRRVTLRRNYFRPVEFRVDSFVIFLIKLERHNCTSSDDEKFSIISTSWRSTWFPVVSTLTVWAYFSFLFQITLRRWLTFCVLVTHVISVSVVLNNIRIFFRVFASRELLRFHWIFVVWSSHSTFSKMVNRTINSLSSL